MPDRRIIKKEALRLLRIGEVRSSLDYLLDQLNQEHVGFQKIILLKTRFEELEKKSHVDKWEPHKYLIRRNQINHALVELVMSLEKTYAPKKLNLEQVKEEAQRLLEEEGLENSLSYLSTEFEDRPKVENLIILLSARWNSLRNDKVAGLIPKKFYRTRKKHLKKALAATIGEISEKHLVKEEKENPTSKVSKKKRKNKQQIHLLRSILSLQVAIIMGIAYLIFHLPI